MRERVVVKSPVRKNRTPGSVRGALGNRRPYLDGMKGLHLWRAPTWEEIAAAEAKEKTQ